MSDLVKVTIDGVEVEVPKGTLVIRAAERIGKYIPRFCDHPLLDPLGACRQCLVEIEGQRKPLTACTTTVTDGMVVKTQFTSEVAADAQAGVLELLLINHPLDCPTCDKGGECPLQDQALAYGPGGSRYVDPKRRFVKPVAISPLVRLDRERCVLCARCTRFADQISGDPFIELFERGALEQVAIFEDEPYESIFSGNVTQICPVGALLPATFRFAARPFDMTTTPSTCNRCASGCSIDVQARRGELVRVLARENHDVNDEWLCDKGRFAYAYVSRHERVTEPVVRKGDEFVAVSWGEAIDEVVRGIGEARSAGLGAAVLAGGQLLDEDAYALSRFARTVLGTNDVDSRMDPGGDEEEHILVGIQKSVGATYADIDSASTIVVSGLDLEQESPIVFLRVRKAARRGARVLEVSPRHAFGGGKVARAQWVACDAGDEARALMELEGTLGDGRVVVLAGERLRRSAGALTGAWNLALASGGVFGWIPRKAGARGAIAAGLHPALLPGGRSVRWAQHRAHAEEIWGAAVPEFAGRDSVSIARAAADIGVLYLAGADPVRDLADPAVRGGLARARFIVAQDLFITETTKHANVILPAASGYERDGTLTNWEGRAQQVRQVVPSAGLAQADHEILAQVAEGMGVSFPRTLEALRREMRRFDPEAHAPERLPAPEGSARAVGSSLLPVPMLLDDGTMMLGADALLESAASAAVEIHPDDASGVAEGATVRVSGSAGSVEVPVRVRASVARGAVSVPSYIARAVAAPGETVTVERV